MLSIPSISTEYLKVPVVGADPLLPVEMAVVPTGVEPVEIDWLDAEWDADDARLLIGPNGGAVTLANGEYGVWVRITAPPEKPVLFAGHLIIT